MLRLTAILAFTILVINASSQTRGLNELIAEGGARTKVRPDIAMFTLTIEKRDTIEKNAIKSLNQEIESLVVSLNKVGFTNTAIKVSGYEISSSRNDQDKKEYAASNILKIEFHLDNKLIDAFYNEIQAATINDLDVLFDTKVSDDLEQTTRLRLVQLAIKDARINADNISKTLGIKIIKVKQVQKYTDLVRHDVRVEMVKLADARIVGATDIRFKTSFDKFQVEDVELEEKITIVYEISK